MERALLYGYWAVSGYGLRAWRAATTLAVVHVASAGLYTLPAFATVTQPAAQIEVVDLTSGAVTLHRPLPPPEALCGRAILTMTSRSAGASAILAQIRSPASRAVQSAPVSSLRYGGSMIGLSFGSRKRNVIVPRLCGRSRIGPNVTACPRCGSPIRCRLRPGQDADPLWAGSP